MADRAAARHDPILSIDDLHVYYGQGHVLQGVSLRLEHGVLAIVGRNGMGKTTLCNAIMGLVPPTRGSILLAGEQIIGLRPHAIVARGIGYVPQGRRVWPSLTVDEHLRLAARRQQGAVDHRAGLRDLSGARRAPAQWRRAAVGRRAADAGHRPCAAGQPAAAGDGRAERRAGADHRRAGRADPAAADDRGRNLRPAGRAEPRRRHRGRR